MTATYITELQPGAWVAHFKDPLARSGLRSVAEVKTVYRVHHLGRAGWLAGVVCAGALRFDVVLDHVPPVELLEVLTVIAYMDAPLQWPEPPLHAEHRVLKILSVDAAGSQLRRIHRRACAVALRQRIGTRACYLLARRLEDGAWPAWGRGASDLITKTLEEAEADIWTYAAMLARGGR